ncbi:PAS domain-containing protein [Paracraurococcus lichenis]|uniref:histidine kinase n=1 Tax=Paracraurococcus lichenis TaxID=3064888 RepID=A0ABT9E5T2_9PROT|nr:PAS domain-containing protein [Paracraurococcus sp. LOR1-02]MDO9711531.1 PAS domain-containing protein [Paracraurococcus sp. LOR1-02]
MTAGALPGAPRGGDAARVLAFGLAYLLAALLGHALTLRPVAVASVWPAAGLYLAALLLAPPRRWPPLIGAAAAANLAADVLVMGRPPLLVLGFVLANALEVLAGAALLRLLLRGRRPQPGLRLRDTVALGAAALAAPAVGGAVGAAAANALAGAPFAAVWPVWWAADVVGNLVVAPLLLAAAPAWRRPGRAAAGPLWWLEAAAAHAAVLGAAAAVFWLATPMVPLPFLTMPPLLWAALRLGPLATASASALLALCAVGAVAAGFGPFDHGSLAPSGQAVLLQLFIAVATATAQLLAAATAERRTALSRLTAANARLEAAVAARTAELAASEAQMRLLVEGVEDVFWMCEPETGRSLYIGPAFARIFGRPLPAVPGPNAAWIEAIHPEDRERAVATFRARALTTGYDLEYRIRRPDGELRWLRERGWPVPTPAGAPRRAAGLTSDITERRRAAEALADSEAVLRLSQEQARIASFSLDLRSGMLRCAPGAMQVFGFAPDRDGMTLEEWHSTIHPEDAGRIARQRAEALDRRDPGAHFEYRVVRPDTDAVLDVEMRARCEYAADGTPLRVLGVAIDVTDWKRAEAALAASEARLRDLLATLDLGAAMARDMDGTIRHWSKGCERLYGWTAAEAVGRISHDLLRTVFPVTRGEIEAALRRDGEWAGDLRHRRRDGREVVVAARKVLRQEKEGGPGSVLEVLEDVTAQRRAEAALAASEARLRLAVEGTGLATWDVDLASGEAVWSPNHFGMFGYAPEPSGRATYAMWCDRIHPEDWPAIEAANRAAMRGATPFRLAYRIRRRDDGAERWIETSGRFLDHGPDGAPRRVIGVNLDATERREAEAALAGSEARLRSVVETAADGILVADAAGGVVLANRAALRIFGYDDDPDGLLGRDLERLMPEAEAARHGGYLAAHRATGQARAIGVPGRTLMGRRRDGSEFPIDLSVGSFEVGGERFFTGVVRDVSQRVTAEAALRESEALLRLAQEAAGVGIFECDLATGRTEWSATMFRLYGLDPAGPAPGMAPGGGHTALVHPGDRGWLGERRAAMVADPAADLFEHEFRILRAETGEERWIAARGEFVRDAAGRARLVRGGQRDITDRRATEAALAASEARFRALAEAIPSLLFETDAEGGAIYLNPRFTEYTGLPQDALTGDGWLRILHPEDRARTAEAWTAAIRSGGSYDIEYRLRRHDGAFRWFLGRAVPVRDGGGGIARWVGTCTDIEDRRQAEAALRESEARLRIEAERVDLALRAGAILGTWDWDLPSDRFTVDERFAESFGIDPALGRTGLALEQVIATVHPDDLAGLRAAIAEVIGRGGAYSHEYRVRGRDGIYRWIEANGRVDHAPDGTPLRFPGVLLDAGQRRAAEERLRENEVRLRLALEAGGMGYWSWDLATDRLEWDARQFALFGLDPTRGQPSGEEALSTVHPDDLPGLTAAIESALAAGDGVFSHEFRVVHRGGVRWLAGHGHAVPGPDGRATRMVGLNFDVTARREAEAVLAREAEQLDRLAEERGRALAESQARLAHASKMEALGRLAGGIAHDFNNVLQAVQGGITLASKRLHSDPAAVQRYLGLAGEAAGRGAAVTGRLLSFARRSELRAEPLAPGPLLAGMAEFLRPAIGPNIAIRVEAAAGLPPMLADRSQLEAVLANLANNARDAMPGGGTLTLAAKAVAVPRKAGSPSGLAAGVYVQILVADEGEGMPPEVLARVSEPFFTTKPEGKGTGLGLAMARGFAEQSGGGLSIDSAPGRGTTVSIWLPRVQEEVPPQYEIPDLPAANLAGLPPGAATLLLVEDKPEVRAVLAAQFEDHGYAVRQAEDAAAALAMLRHGLRPDALITDLTMPGTQDGLDLVVGARSLLPRLPAVLVTGHAGDAMPGRFEEAERSGPFALVRKPASPEALLDRLARVLRQSGVVGRAAR